MSASRRRLLGIPLLVVLAVLIALPTDSYGIYVLTIAMVSTIPAVGLAVLMGYAGYISAAQGVFFGVGAYATAIMTVEWGMNYFLALPLSAVAAVIVALLLAAPVFRTRALYFAVITLGIGLVAENVFDSAESVTGGVSGYAGIPKPDQIPLLGISLESLFAQYLLAVALLLVAYLIAAAFVRSRLGRAALALREDELLANSLGIRVGLARVSAFVVAAAIAAIGGSYFAAISSYVAPESFSVATAGFQAIVIGVVGGTGTLWGPLGAGVLRTASPELLRAADEYGVLAYGVLLLLIVRFAPDGIAGILRRAVARWRSRGDRDVPLGPGDGAVGAPALAGVAAGEDGGR
jgi:branched-chain amino acid transport system permease protein